MRTPNASEFFITGLKSPALSVKELSFLKNHFLGGIILFKRNIETLEQVVDLNQALIEANPAFPPLLSVDQEGGRVARLRGICTDLPPMAKLAKSFLKEPKYSYRMGAMQGRELAALGFNLNFSPVCDVLNHDQNEVIGDRAFSDSAEVVATLTKHYIQGLQGAGVAGCAKHFPGHGATAIDSHFSLPVLETDLDVLMERELLPFRSAIDADVATIMTAHIITKSLDTLPATMSSATLQHLLRDELLYKNIVISDDLDMKAVADHFSLKEILEKGMHASVDFFIIGNDFDKTEAAIALLQEMIDTDEAILQKAVNSALRIERFRNRYLGKPKAPELSSAKSIVRSKPHLELVASCS